MPLKRFSVPQAENILIGHAGHFLIWLLQRACLLLQDQKIYIYSLKGMCPLSMPQQALDTPAVVTCFLAVPVIKKVRWGEGHIQVCHQVWEDLLAEDSGSSWGQWSHTFLGHLAQVIASFRDIGDHH